MSEGQTSCRREVYYSGMVQGVGFRYTVRGIAARYAVVGFVRNLPDGRVHLVVEGLPEEVDLLLAAIAAEMGHYIRGTQQKTGPMTDQFRGFDIRF